MLSTACEGAHRGSMPAGKFVPAADLVGFSFSASPDALRARRRCQAGQCADAHAAGWRALAAGHPRRRRRAPHGVRRCLQAPLTLLPEAARMGSLLNMVFV